jgi:predicted 2-oxoglutarate/Fe(II)-dependent dioxygenase YbiX
MAKILMDEEWVCVRSEFASPEDSKALILGFQQVLGRTSGPDWGGAVRQLPNRTELACRFFEDAQLPDAAARVSELRARMLRQIRDHFAARCYPDLTLMSEMRIGDAHALHADAERQSLDGSWGENHTYWRTYVGLLYLNTSGTDYTGGVLRLPSVGMEIVPRTGLLVAFPCGRRYEHEVTPIISGSRFSIALWTSGDESRTEPWI